jgi:N6-L-threonylcarbamoyladenine synthase
MITLAIETSCDETAVCLLETRRQTRQSANAGSSDTDIFEYRILANLIHSQADLHAKYGGVFPMMAKREHEKNLPILLEKIPAGKIDRIAVTRGPGLEPALWAGIDFARQLGEKLSVPVVGVNHMEGHVLGSLLTSSSSSSTSTSSNEETFTLLRTLPTPALALLISGGHTELVVVKNTDEKKNAYEVIGRTKDDAVGEAYDKVARLLGLPYPGGPRVGALAEQARKENIPSALRLPRPMLHSKDLDFSFSGLKTAVLYEIRKTDENASMKPVKAGATSGAANVHDHGLTEEKKKEIAREFEDAVTEVLVKKTAQAIETYGVQALIVGGGVIANIHIRAALQKLAEENSIPLYFPPEGVSGDNALMIALAGACADAPTSANDHTSANGPLKADGNLSL